MNAEQLRASILQEAIQGKLVPQLDSEGAVEQVGEIPEEVPFEIPESWKWERMSSIIDVRDGTHDTPKYVEQGVPFVTSKNLKNGKIDFATVKYISQNDHTEFCKRSKVEEGDILMAMIGTIGNSLIVPRGLPEFSIKNIALLKKKAEIKIDFSYVLFALKAFEQLMDKQSSGSVQKFVSLKYLRNMPFPVPPLEEQKRIVAKIEELLPLVEEYGKSYDHLQKINAELPEKLKASILQEAIQGRLVPQLESEPAVKTFVDEPEEVPFDIPKSWKWCHMKEITQKIHYGFTASAVNSGSARLLRITDIQDGRVNWKGVPFCDIPENKLASYKLKENDVVIARTGGTIGKSFLLTGVSDVAVFASYLIRLIPNTDIIDPKYLMMFLNSPEYWKQLKAMSQGTGQPNVNAKSLSTLLIPIPPIEEQYRIVQKLESLLSKVNELTNT